MPKDPEKSTILLKEGIKEKGRLISRCGEVEGRQERSVSLGMSLGRFRGDLRERQRERGLM